MASLLGVIVAVSSMFLALFSFWYKKIFGRWKTRTLVDGWLDQLQNAQGFEHWEQAALELDSLKKLNLWRGVSASRSYDSALIHDRLNSLMIARDSNNLQAVIDLVRSGLVRNLGNITSPRLYNRSFAGTKYLIQEYVGQVVGAVEDINAQTTTSVLDNERDVPKFSTQQKLDFLHDSRQAFGRSTLVLQGGAIFGLCHLGVVKALFLRGLLPRIITGTATGALIASLVAIHTDDELPNILKGEGIDLSAFEAHDQQVHGAQNQKWASWAGTSIETLIRRVRRFWNEGYFLDVKILEDCVKANVGDMTFEEAYQRSKRVLNITITTSAHDGVPALLNYISAPNVLIWSAAVASNVANPSLYGSKYSSVLCKDLKGNIVPWAPANNFRPWTPASGRQRKFPLSTVAHLFNVNHFIVSQARPYLIPFMESDMHGPSLYTARHKRAQITGHLFRILGLEVRHRLRQLDMLGLLPISIRRFLVDEDVPGPSVMLVPKVKAGDFVRLLETPTRETLDYWILRGERSVWPAVSALTVRCAIEYDIERAYQRARSLKAGGLRRKASTSAADSLANPPARIASSSPKTTQDAISPPSAASVAGAKFLASWRLLQREIENRDDSAAKAVN